VTTAAAPAAPALPAQLRASDGLLVGAVLAVLAILIVPLPSILLDTLLAFNIGLAVTMLFIAVSLTRPLEFSVFPSLLLVTTLFRLGLNVATTRLILLRGSEGSGAVGHVIETFGRLVIGGSVIVGAVVFLILMVVNFTVITKGSGRVSEVAARFTLDALPGKQMSIDADLAAGIIDDRAARARRSQLEQETEFFGAMDGASKFVRGDAVAALVITGINLIGGFAMGMLRDHLSLDAAIDTYSVLTIGDGLVSQIPGLLISTSAGIVVTRAAGADLGSQVRGQMFGNAKVLQSSAAVLGFLGLLPGLPIVPFALLAGGCVALARRLSEAERKPTAAAEPEKKLGPQAERIQDALSLDALELEVGFALIPIIDASKGAELPGRITALRKQLATDLGVVLPSMHLRDNLRLEPNTYCVKLRGNVIGRGTAYPDRLLVLTPGGTAPEMQGIVTKEPAFGLPAVWILPAERAAAEQRGYTVVDPSSTVTTHLSELLRRFAFELVGRQEVQELLAACAKEAPKLVEDTIPGAITLGELVRVVRGLLREGISVRDLRTILEGVADAAPRSKDTVFLVEQVRRRLSRQITGRLTDDRGVVRAMTFDRATEDMLRSTLGASDGEPALAPDIEMARRLAGALEARAAGMLAAGRQAVILSPPDLRHALFDFASRFVPDLWVVTARELTPGTTVEPEGVIQLGTPGLRLAGPPTT
jgi:flagellar biosynthesis protein FlhA